MNGIRGIYYRELKVLRSRLVKTLLSSSVSPLLFLLAFGYGVGRYADVDGVGYVAFLIPGLVAMSSMNMSYGISTEINISRFYFRVFEVYMLAPVKRWEIVAGETLYGVTKGLIPVCIVLLYAYVSGIYIMPSLLFVPVILLHLMIFSLLGLIVALVVKNHGDQFAVNTFVITPMVFLSGTFYPVDKMPDAVRYIAQIFPLTYSTKLIRYSLIGGDVSPAGYVALLCVMAGVLFAAACIIVRRIEA